MVRPHDEQPPNGAFNRYRGREGALAGQAANIAGATGPLHGQDTELAHITPWQKKVLSYLDDGGSASNPVSGAPAYAPKTNPVSGAPSYAPPLLWSPEASRATIDRYGALGLPEPSPIYIEEGTAPTTPTGGGSSGGALGDTSEQDFGFPRLRTPAEHEADVNQFQPAAADSGSALSIPPDGGADPGENAADSATAETDSALDFAMGVLSPVATVAKSFAGYAGLFGDDDSAIGMSDQDIGHDLGMGALGQSDDTGVAGAAPDAPGGGPGISGGGAGTGSAAGAAPGDVSGAATGGGESGGNTGDPGVGQSGAPAGGAFSGGQTGAEGETPGDAGNTGESPGGGDGDGSGDSVICTALNADEVLDDPLYRAGVRHTARYLSPTTFKGYRAWGPGAVRLMKRRPLVYWLGKTLMGARAREIGHVMGVRDRPDWLGRAVRVFGEPVCWLIGRVVCQKEPIPIP